MSRTIAQLQEDNDRITNEMSADRARHEEQIKGWATSNRSLVQANEILQTRSLELQERNQYLESRICELEDMLSARSEMEREFVEDAPEPLPVVAPHPEVSETSTPSAGAGSKSNSRSGQGKPNSKGETTAVS